MQHEAGGAGGAQRAALAVQAHGLTKQYRTLRRHVHALRGADFDIRSGEVFGLLGPNGAGKTTFVKCLLGLLRPTSGDITLFGMPPTETTARRRVGFAPEVPSFPPFLSAPEVMRLHGRLIGLSSDEVTRRTDELLAQAELEDAPRRIKAFSKGMVPPPRRWLRPTSASRTSSSSTSQPPTSIRSDAATSGTSSWPSRSAVRRSCSTPTCSRRSSASATGSRSSTAARCWRRARCPNSSPRAKTSRPSSSS